MEIEGIAATTHIVDRGSYRVRLAREALEEAVKQINGPLAVRMTPNHDPLCMPIGKVQQAWLRELDDGEWALVHRMYIDDEPVFYSLPSSEHDGSTKELVILRFPQDPRPLMIQHNSSDVILEVGVEVVNFRDTDSFDEFKNRVRRDDQDVSIQTLERHEVGPEPLIEFIVSHISLWEALAWSTGGWFLSRLRNPCKYIVDEVLQEVADGVVETLRPKIRRIFERYQQRAAEDDRKTPVAIQLNASPVVKLYARIGEEDTFPDIELSNIVATLTEYDNFVAKAREVVLEWDGDGWRFRYATSDEGEVLGTKVCFECTLDEYNSLTRPQEED